MNTGMTTNIAVCSAKPLKEGGTVGQLEGNDTLLK
jgi:hypothetical protein